ncbi:hypothetical protein D9M71_387910 [compost metagenome]
MGKAGNGGIDLTDRRLDRSLVLVDDPGQAQGCIPDVLSDAKEHFLVEPRHLRKKLAHLRGILLGQGYELGVDQRDRVLRGATYIAAKVLQIVECIVEFFGEPSG